MTNQESKQRGMTPQESRKLKTNDRVGFLDVSIPWNRQSISAQSWQTTNTLFKFNGMI